MNCPKSSKKLSSLRSLDDLEYLLFHFSLQMVSLVAKFLCPILIIEEKRVAQRFRSVLRFRSYPTSYLFVRWSKNRSHSILHSKQLSFYYLLILASVILKIWSTSVYFRRNVYWLTTVQMKRKDVTFTYLCFFECYRINNNVEWRRNYYLSKPLSELLKCRRCCTYTYF